MEKITQRLDKLREFILSRDFLEGKGLSNEVNIRIFCYDPKDEMTVRHFIKHRLLLDSDIGNGIFACDLYELFIEICREMDILDGILEMEIEDGSGFTLDRLHSAVGEEEFVSKLLEKSQGIFYDVMVMMGIGDVFPFMRVHKLLEAMQPHFSGKPILVLYPGVYDGNSFRLFNRLSPNLYYGAFSVF